jgi:DNA-binding transcriptional ArsR family regulator
LSRDGHPIVRARFHHSILSNPSAIGPPLSRDLGVEAQTCKEIFAKIAWQSVNPAHRTQRPPADDESVDPNDPRKLRGLAHPLRLRILGLLRSGGPSTATRLADELGESTGATSYHLRQLATYGFVVPDEDREARGKERWWRSAARYTELPRVQAREGHEGAEGFLRALAADFYREMEEFLDALHAIPAEWDEGWTLSDRFLRVTPEEAQSLRLGLRELIGQFRRNAPAGDQEGPDDARLVLVQVQILPKL